MKHYTPNEDAVIKTNAGAKTAKEIGRLIKRSTQSIYNRAALIGVVLGQGRYTSEEDALIQKHAKTKSAQQIGNLIGKTALSVRSRARLLQISLMKHGESHHLAVYSNDDVQLVRELLEDGEMTCKDIAKKMEMNVSTVYAIKAEQSRRER